MLTHIPRHFKVPLDVQPSLKSSPFKELIFGRAMRWLLLNTIRTKVNPEMKFKRSLTDMSLLWRSLACKACYKPFGIGWALWKRIILIPLSGSRFAQTIFTFTRLNATILPSSISWVLRPLHMLSMRLDPFRTFLGWMFGWCVWIICFYNLNAFGDEYHFVYEEIYITFIMLISCSLNVLHESLF